MKVCGIKSTGGVDKLIFKDLDLDLSIKDNEVLLKQTAIGIGFEDILYRKGEYQIPPSFLSLDFLPLGLTAVGIIEDNDKKIKNFSKGDKVIYPFGPFFGYSEYRKIDYRYLIKIEKDFDDFTNVAIFRRALAAYYLLFKLFQGKEGDWILVHSVANGIGQIIAKWAKASGYKVIGTIGDEQKRVVALSMGCDLIINRKTSINFSNEVFEVTKGAKVLALFDGIGKDVFEESIKCIRVSGVYINFGSNSGKILDIDINLLKKFGIFFIAPAFELFYLNRNEMLLASYVVFDAIEKGHISINITKYGFDAINQAHIDLESKKTTGALVVMT